MKEHIKLTVRTRWPERLDAYLADTLEDVSRTKIKAFCKNGLVRVDGVPRKGSFSVQDGQVIETPLPEPEVEIDIIPQNIPLDVVYEDPHMIVINKQAGLVVHPGAGVKDTTLVNALVYHFNQLSQSGGTRPGIVHRLDRGTTGLMVVAKTDAAHAALTSAWQSGEVTKVYQALVWGRPDPESGEVESRIGRHPTDRKRMTANTDNGRFAHSRYKVVELYPEAARVNIHILTGRTHQIRVHMAHLDHPVVGDALYGGRRHMALVKQFEAMPEYPMLHAGLLKFPHPKSGEEMGFKLVPGEAFEKIANALSVWPY
ncbi:MAG: RluA family pseudouridine synthase [Acidobacteria bacterium]|nr:RluA family pseudouridine synthase [Acidobacteriota bacterium]